MDGSKEAAVRGVFALGTRRRAALTCTTIPSWRFTQLLTHLRLVKVLEEINKYYEIKGRGH